MWGTNFVIIVYVDTVAPKKYGAISRQIVDYKVVEVMKLSNFNSVG